MTQVIDKYFIAVEGPDGVGKSTQTKYLVEWLKDYIIEGSQINTHFRVEQFKELNDNDFIFKDIRSFVYSLYKKVSTPLLAEIIKINRYLVYDQLISDHTNSKDYDFTTKKVRWYKNIAICDRWNISTYCYLKAEGYDELALSYLQDDNTVVPGLTIMLVGENAAIRTANRPDNNNMFEDRSDDYNSNLAQTYIDFDTNLYAGNVVKINNDNLTKEDTMEIVREVVKNYLHTL